MKKKEQPNRKNEIVSSLKTSGSFFLCNYIYGTDKIKIDIDFIGSDLKSYEIVLMPRVLDQKGGMYYL